MRKAFTLIEVMVSVMIISVVIAALLQMRGESAFLFSDLKKKIHANQLMTFFIRNKNYGFKNESISFDNLAEGFEIDDDLRRYLKSIKVDVIHQPLKSIDFSDSSTVFEISKTIIHTKNSSTFSYRLKIQ